MIFTDFIDIAGKKTFVSSLCFAKIKLRRFCLFSMPQREHDEREASIFCVGRISPEGCELGNNTGSSLLRPDLES